MASPEMTPRALAAPRRPTSELARRPSAGAAQQRLLPLGVLRYTALLQEAVAGYSRTRGTVLYASMGRGGLLLASVLLLGEVP